MITEQSQATPYVFLSYASSNRAWALHVADVFEEHGIGVWIDRRSITGGTSWSGEIVRGIEGCAALVILSSAAAMASPNVQQEIQLAWESRRPIVPILIERVHPPEAIRYVLAGRQWIEALDYPDEIWVPQALRALASFGIVTVPRKNTDTSPITDAPKFSPIPTRTSGLVNLPAQNTSIVGREQQVRAVSELVNRPDVRLVTLTGPGGVGKTRLALAVAAQITNEFNDGVVFVPLGTVVDPEAVATAIARSLGVRESVELPALAQLKSYLREKCLLLVLDNFEQMLPAVVVLRELLTASSRLKVIVTSREILHAYGEHEFPVPPLQLPDLGRLPQVDRLAGVEAVRLFLHRAQAVKPDFVVTEENATAVAEICHRLDGLPLAIELAAARIRLLPPQAILTRLSNRLKLLTGGAQDLPTRHQTLYDAIAWSYDLLTADERVVFRRLAAFVGRFRLEAAEAVCRAAGAVDLDLLDGLESLVGKSLVLPEPLSGQPCFAMLSTIREFGLARLTDSGEADATRQAHAAWYLALAENLNEDYYRPASPNWLQQLDQEDDNLIAALRFFLDRSDNEHATRLAGALGWFWYLRGFFWEGRQGLETVIARPGARSLARAEALIRLGHLTFDQGDFDRAEAWLDEGVALARACGEDTRAIRTILWGTMLLGLGARDRGDFPRAAALAEEALAMIRGRSNPQGEWLIHHLRGSTAWYQGDLDLAVASGEQSLVLSRQMGSSALAVPSEYLGRALYARGEYARAKKVFAEALDVSRRYSFARGIAIGLLGLGKIAVVERDFATAHACYAESLALCRDVGDRRNMARLLEESAWLRVATGAPKSAACLLGAADAMRTAIGLRIPLLERVDHERYLSEIHEALDESGFVSAWSEGHAMTTAQAVVYALEEDST